MHWGTSAGDSTVWVHERKDVQMALSTSAQAVLEQLALLPAPPDFATITPDAGGRVHPGVTGGDRSAARG